MNTPSPTPTTNVLAGLFAGFALARQDAEVLEWIFRALYTEEELSALDANAKASMALLRKARERFQIGDA